MDRLPRQAVIPQWAAKPVRPVVPSMVEAIGHPTVALPRPLRPARSARLATAAGAAPAGSRVRGAGDVAWGVVAVDVAALATASALFGGVAEAGPIVFSGLVLAVNAAGGHYRRRLCPSVLDDAAGLAARALAAAAAATLVGDVLGAPPRGGVLVEAVCFLTLTVVTRATLGYPLTRRWRRRNAGWPTVVVGCGPLGHRVATALRDHPEHGLAPVCFLDDVDGADPDGGELPVAGRVSDLPEVAAVRGVRAVVVADPLTSEPMLVDLVRGWHRLACEIYLVPRMPDLAGSAEYVWGVP